MKKVFRSFARESKVPRLSPIIVWFNLDLRLSDQPALRAAAQAGHPIIPCYVWDDEVRSSWRPGSASRWWLHHSLTALDQQFRQRGGSLVLRRGPVVETLLSLVYETSSKAVFWSTKYDPKGKRDSERLQSELNALGLEARVLDDGLLFNPDEIHTQTGQPFQRFTPFAKACLKRGPTQRVHRGPDDLSFYSRAVKTESLETWGFVPRNLDWSVGLQRSWQPGEVGAIRQFDRFLGRGVTDYTKDRDNLDFDGTSRLSPHLHFGELSVAQVWSKVSENFGGDTRLNVDGYLRQLLWREFSYHLLMHWPDLPSQPIRREYVDFPWQPNQDWLTAWQRGQTGYPIIDAGLRQLRYCGWMHNRVRMVAASFLVKQLLVPWQDGQAWFWESLVDADLANNAASWQWIAGCGVDAAPYYRIFNPVIQGKKFDPAGQYVRRWVPELERLPDRWIHEPWLAPRRVVESAGFRLDRDYPRPIIDLDVGRQRALAAWQSIRSRRKTDETVGLFLYSPPQ